MSKLRIPAPVSGGLMLSYKCQAACRHCMYACSPRWSGDWMTEDEIEQCLTRLAPYVRPSPRGPESISLNHGLHFSGGEPFLRFDLLLSAVQMADSLGVPSIFVETNCFWCKDDESTRDKLMQLREAGLRGILISVNPFYAEYVPFERTRRSVRISREVFGQNTMVCQAGYFRLFERQGLTGKISLEEFISDEGQESLTGGVELFLTGRAARELRDLYPSYPARRFFGGRCRPAFLRSWHNHFDNYGNVMPGYCGGVSVGDWHNLDELVENGIELEAHPVLAYLVNEDLCGLYQFAGDHGYQAREGGYVSRCDLCLDIRKYLVEEVETPVLRPKEFYEHIG